MVGTHHGHICRDPCRMMLYTAMAIFDYAVCSLSGSGYGGSGRVEQVAYKRGTDWHAQHLTCHGRLHAPSQLAGPHGSGGPFANSAVQLQATYDANAIRIYVRQSSGQQDRAVQLERTWQYRAIPEAISGKEYISRLGGGAA